MIVRRQSQEGDPDMGTLMSEVRPTNNIILNDYGWAIDAVFSIFRNIRIIFDLMIISINEKKVNGFVGFEQLQVSPLVKAVAWLL
ncbi:hypothetical protein N9L33_05340 [Nitrospinae bacterium]|nr:hypothetical protein [Nitrospinota bacterium]